MSADMGELGLIFRGIEAYLREQRSAANFEPVTREEQRQVKRIFAGGRVMGGRCTHCGEKRLHVDGEVS